MPSHDWYECPIVIPYYGGKYELSKKLVPMIPSHNRYIEVFAGGLSMFFRKGKSKDSIVNDFDSDIANLYLSIADDLDKFKEYCKMLPKSRQIFASFKEELKNKEIDIPNIKRAVKYYYCIKNAFNKNIYTNITKDGDWNTNMLEFIHISRGKLDGVLIENFDFRTLYDKYPVKEKDFWYFDPPYVIAGERGDYYFFDFTKDDHRDLFKMTSEIDKKGGKFMVSYDDHELVWELYKDFEITTIPVIYAGQTTKRNYKNELVITNYKPESEQLTLI